MTSKLYLASTLTGILLLNLCVFTLLSDLHFNSIFSNLLYLRIVCCPFNFNFFGFLSGLQFNRTCLRYSNTTLSPFTIKKFNLNTPILIFSNQKLNQQTNLREKQVAKTTNINIMIRHANICNYNQVNNSHTLGLTRNAFPTLLLYSAQVVNRLPHIFKFLASAPFSQH